MAAAPTRCSLLDGLLRQQHAEETAVATRGVAVCRHQRLHVAVEVVDGCHACLEGTVETDGGRDVARERHAEFVRRGGKRPELFCREAGMNLDEVVPGRMLFPHLAAGVLGPVDGIAVQRGTGSDQARTEHRAFQQVLA